MKIKTQKCTYYITLHMQWAESQIQREEKCNWKRGLCSSNASLVARQELQTTARP